MPEFIEEQQASYPGEILTSGITYIQLRKGWLYLSVAVDIYLRNTRLFNE